MKPFHLALLAPLAALVFGSSLRAEVSLDRIWRSNMVMQRNAMLLVTGSCRPGERVLIKAPWGENANGIGGADGRFAVELRTGDEPGPHQLVVRGDYNEFMLDNVLLGEVWIASGQSNMEMPVGWQSDGYSGVENWEEEVSRSAYELIRLYTVENDVSDAPRADVKGDWLLAGPESVKAFSATAWFFARMVSEESQVPVGIVAADWGGTPIEAWIGAEALESVGEFADALKAVRARAADRAGHAAGQDEAMRAWRAAFDAAERGVKEGWQMAAFDDSSWAEVQVPAPLPQGFGEHDGTVWLRRRVTIPDAWAGDDCRLEFGAVDDCDTTWWNGVQAGETMGAGRWNEPRSYLVPAERVRGGSSVVAVRVLDFAGASGITGKWDDCRLHNTRTNQEIKLGGYWKVAIGTKVGEFPPYPRRDEAGPWTPTALYNAMIAPLAGLRPRGAIWYQGESNRGRADQYAKLFPALVRDWRRLFREDLAFYAVQIAPFGYGNDQGETGALRQAQRSILALPGTGLVSTLDIGDPKDIHPKRKLEVGTRLARMALNDFHGWTALSRSGPEPVECLRKLNAVTVRFDCPLKALSDPIAGFEAGCDDGKWYPLVAQIAGDEVVLRGTLPAKASRVRYAWGTLDTASIGSADGTPACTFQLEIAP